MRFKFTISVFLVSVLSLFIIHYSLFIAVRAQDCGSNLNCQIDQIQREIDALSPAQEKNKQDLAGLRKQLSNLTAKVTLIFRELKKVESQIKSRQEDLAYTQKIFEEKTQNYYKFFRLYDPILPFLSSQDAASAFRKISFRQKAADEDRKTMEKYGQDLLGLKNDRQNLEKNKTSLDSAQKQVAEKEKFLAGEVVKVESYLSSLSARQNELIALKSGGFQTSIGDTPPTLEPCSGAPSSANFCDPGFRPAFGAFSFGAPHRTGLSQYGAYGRSKSGQNAETILSAYYQGASLNKSYPTSTNICVGSSKSSCTNVSLETYVNRIYEVPNSWGDSNGMEALKAQAVAARSYALYQMKGVGFICPTESCQVYKSVNKGGNWETAVNATTGWVLEKGGSPAPAYFSASTGGYTISQWGWSGIKDASSDWPGSAYEKIGGSPWFYKGWFKARSGASCGRSNPWLTAEEMADILNAWSVINQGGDVSRIWPEDCLGQGHNSYSKSELQAIGGYTSVSSSSVIYGNNGSTINVTFQTNKGGLTLSGEEFKKAFNLRAPGYLGLKSSLFNIEKL